MNENQKMKMELLKSFGISDEPKTVNFCREAYNFLTEDGEIKRIQNEQNANNNITAPSEPTAIDLGLPSGTLWCDRNVGAKSPEDCGAYFSWGNVEPHYTKESLEHEWGYCKDAFDYSFDEDEYKDTKGGDISESDLVDGHLPAERDAATHNMGEDWKMPTKEQFQELYDNCTWTRKVRNGMNGYVVKSKVNGAELFFPCSGHGDGSSRYDRSGSGYYWSSSFYSSRYARNLYFHSGGVNPQSSSYRYYGFAVRPVK